VASWQGSLTVDGLSRIINSLSEISSECREAREVLAALTPKIDECQQVFNAMQIRRSLYGLQKMSSDVREVKNVLAALASKIERVVGA
jgi:hypothetical protein